MSEESWHALVGTMADTAIARENGVSMWVVRGYRLKHEIPTFRTGRKPTQKPTRSWAWIVRTSAGEPSDRVVIANGLMHAVRKAAAVGDVVGIERVRMTL